MRYFKRTLRLLILGVPYLLIYAIAWLMEDRQTGGELMRDLWYGEGS